jgi:hypothetical protein
VQQAPPGSTRRPSGKVLGLLLAVSLIAGGIALLLPAKAQDRIPAPAGPYVLDSRIQAAGALIGLTPDQLTRVHVQFDSPWPGGEALGMYLSRPRTIIINPSYAQRAPLDVAAVIAYEYMHDVWTRHSHPVALMSWMDAVVDTYPEAARHLDETLDLDGTTDVRATELLSIACTQTVDAHMNPGLVAYCDQELPGRHNLPVTNFVY